MARKSFAHFCIAVILQICLLAVSASNLSRIIYIMVFLSFQGHNFLL